MTAVKREVGDFVIEVQLLAKAFDLTEDDIRERMRDGGITSRCETGVVKDAGRWRLSFHHGDRACRFIVDEAGTVIKKATFPIKTRPQEPVPDNGDTRMKTSATEVDE